MKLYGTSRALLVSLVALAGATLASLPAGADAAEWYVGGAPLSGSASLTASVKTPLVFSVPAAGFRSECPTGSATKLEIREKNKGKVEAIDLNECVVLEPVGCTLTSKEVTTESLVLAATVGPEKSVTIAKTPVKTSFLVVTLGEGCGALSGAKVRYSGEIPTTAPTLQEEKKEQVIEFEGEKGTGLKAEVGGFKDAAFISGSIVEKVGNGESVWGFH